MSSTPPQALIVMLADTCVFLVSLSALGQQKGPACRSAADFLANSQLQDALKQYQTCTKEAPNFNGFMGLAETYSRLGR